MPCQNSLSAEVGHNAFVCFQSVEFVVIRYSSNGKLTYAELEVYPHLLQPLQNYTELHSDTSSM